MLLRVLVVVALLFVLLLAPRVYRHRRTRAEKPAPRPLPLVPERLLAGSPRTFVVFSTPYCATSGPVELRLRAHDPGARLVEIDATREPYLAEAFAVRRAPTVLLADADGRVQARLEGAESVDSYLRTRA